MPLVKVKGGWKWGSKGPFPTKAQALAVARAAYASGYKDADRTLQQEVFAPRMQESKKQA